MKNIISNNSFSIVIPAFNEFSNLEKLCKEIYESLINYNYEIIIINDCSTDNTLEILKSLSKKYNKIKYFSNKFNSGQSYSICKGIKNSSFDIIVTIDADLQNNPNDIKKLLRIYINEGFKLVGGIRLKRNDSYLKIISSIIANKVRSKILNDNCVDTGCGLKVFDKKIFLDFPFFSGIHRFLPALYSGYGYKTYFVNVDHRKRFAGKSKYGVLNRLFKGIKDMYLVLKIIKEKK